MVAHTFSCPQVGYICGTATTQFQLEDKVFSYKFILELNYLIFGKITKITIQFTARQTYY